MWMALGRAPISTAISEAAITPKQSLRGIHASLFDEIIHCCDIVHLDQHNKQGDPRQWGLPPAKQTPADLSGQKESSFIHNDNEENQ